MDLCDIAGSECCNEHLSLLGFFFHDKSFVTLVFTFSPWECTAGLRITMFLDLCNNAMLDMLVYCLCFVPSQNGGFFVPVVLQYTDLVRYLFQVIVFPNSTKKIFYFGSDSTIHRWKLHMYIYGAARTGVWRRRRLNFPTQILSVRRSIRMMNEVERDAPEPVRIPKPTIENRAKIFYIKYFYKRYK